MPSGLPQAVNAFLSRLALCRVRVRVFNHAPSTGISGNPAPSLFTRASATAAKTSALEELPAELDSSPWSSSSDEADVASAVLMTAARSSLVGV
eukprot:2097581-Heterocapsa_arctica.AAC.1